MRFIFKNASNMVHHFCEEQGVKSIKPSNQFFNSLLIHQLYREIQGITLVTIIIKKLPVSP